MKRDLDEHAMTELQLYIENDGEIYRAHTWPCMLNMMRKLMRGDYDYALAVRAFSHTVDYGAKRYCQEFCHLGCPVYTVFPKAERLEVAARMAQEFLDCVKLGEYDGTNIATAGGKPKIFERRAS